jgi:hypothetical protein
MKTTYRIHLPDGSTRFRKHRPSAKHPVTFAIAWFDHKRNKWDATVYQSHHSADNMLASYFPSLNAKLVKFEVVPDLA